MKNKVEEFLLIDELDPKAVLIIVALAIISFPIGYWVVFAPPGWWLL